MPTANPSKKTPAKKRAAQKHEGRITTPFDSRNPKNLQVTPVEAWGKQQTSTEEGFVTELPSGNVVRMTRTLDLAEMLSTGRIPNPLAAIVQDMMAKGTEVFPPTDDMKTIEQLMDLLNATFCRADRKSVV